MSTLPWRGHDAAAAFGPGLGRRLEQPGVATDADRELAIGSRVQEGDGALKEPEVVLQHRRDHGREATARDEQAAARSEIEGAGVRTKAGSTR